MLSSAADCVAHTPVLFLSPYISLGFNSCTECRSTKKNLISRVYRSRFFSSDEWFFGTRRHCENNWSSGLVVDLAARWRGDRSRLLLVPFFFIQRPTRVGFIFMMTLHKFCCCCCCRLRHRFFFFISRVSSACVEAIDGLSPLASGGEEKKNPPKRTMTSPPARIEVEMLAMPGMLRMPRRRFPREAAGTAHTIANRMPGMRAPRLQRCQRF